MNQQLVDQVVRAVLYQGCILYPYHGAAGKNGQPGPEPFAGGRLYPEACSRAHDGAEPCAMQTECLVEGLPGALTLEIAVRFLHPILRDIGALAVPLRHMPAADNPDFFHVVPELTVDGRHYASWQETVERTVRLPAVTAARLLERPATVNFGFPAARSLEPIRNHLGLITGLIVREQEALSGSVELSAEPVDAAVTKITLRLVNQTPAPRGGFGDSDEADLRTFAAAHAILHVRDGAFVSMIDPPPRYAAAAAQCHNLGSRPILLGDEAQRDTLLASPLLLPDYPEITNDRSALREVAGAGPAPGSANDRDHRRGALTFRNARPSPAPQRNSIERPASPSGNNRRTAPIPAAAREAAIHAALRQTAVPSPSAVAEEA
jgi:hydrogenase maturation protease